MLNEFAANTVICTPTDEMTFPAGWVKVQGYTFIKPNEYLEYVEVSTDNVHWQRVQTFTQPSRWACGFWETCVYLPEGSHLIAARAQTSARCSYPNALENVGPVRPFVYNISESICIYCV